LASATAITVVFFLWQALINSKLDNHTRPLDVAGNNVGWILFAQNAGTIKKAIAAKQTPQLHPATEICISASPNLTVFH